LLLNRLATHNRGHPVSQGARGVTGEGGGGAGEQRGRGPWMGLEI
jgi:hypothetical protein